MSIYCDGQVARWGADGVIVGSAIVKVLGEAKSPERRTLRSMNSQYDLNLKSIQRLKR